MARRAELLRALALGALHGPAELLPVSSTAHVTALPLLLGTGAPPADPAARKAFEVALHAGAGAALLVTARVEPLRPARDRDGLAFLAAATLPAAAAGLLLERPVERRLGSPRALAAGLVAGSAALAAADALGPADRRAASARPADGLALGLAQAAALIPGVSRSGATLAAARARGFARPDAAALSRRVALPVLAGAAALKGVRLARGERVPGQGRTLAAGAVASFAATLLAAPLAGRVERARSFAPFAAYRVALAAALLAAARRSPTGPSAMIRP